MWLDLRRPTELGSRIHFLPPQRWFNLFSLHPLVAELRTLIEGGAVAAPVDRAEPWPLWQRVALGVAGLVTFMVVLIAILVAAFKASDPYRQAVAIARRSPAAQEALGTPIEPGWLVTGSLRRRGDRGTAALAFGVSGPNGEGRIRLAASRQGGVWTLGRLELELETATSSIDLARE
jgi:hypothetical protein